MKFRRNARLPDHERRREIEREVQERAFLARSTKRAEFTAINLASGTLFRLARLSALSIAARRSPSARSRRNEDIADG